jgi:hypothetical protein
MMAPYRRPLLALAFLASTTALGACRAQPASDTEIAEAEQPVEQVADNDEAPARETPEPVQAEPTPPTAAFTTSTPAELDDEPKEGTTLAVPQRRDLRLGPSTTATPSRAVLAPRALDTHRLQNSAHQLRTGPVIRPVGAAPANGASTTGSNSVRALEAAPR